MVREHLWFTQSLVNNVFPTHSCAMFGIPWWCEILSDFIWEEFSMSYLDLMLDRFLNIWDGSVQSVCVSVTRHPSTSVGWFVHICCGVCVNIYHQAVFLVMCLSLLYTRRGIPSRMGLATSGLSISCIACPRICLNWNWVQTKTKEH